MSPWTASPTSSGRSPATGSPAPSQACSPPFASRRCPHSGWTRPPRSGSQRADGLPDHGRDPLTQPDRIETVIRTAAAHDVETYTLFALRDGDSSRDELWHQFGVLRSTTSPNPPST